MEKLDQWIVHRKPYDARRRNKMTCSNEGQTLELENFIVITVNQFSIHINPTKCFHEVGISILKKYITRNSQSIQWRRGYVFKMPSASTYLGLLLNVSSKPAFTPTGSFFNVV